VGLGVELGQEHPPLARDDGVCRDPLERLTHLVVADSRVTRDVLEPRTYAVQLAHAVADLERPVVSHCGKDR
jgi:hypothetical protein